MPKILFVANVAKEHILKFHIPSIIMFKNKGWIVDVACYKDAEVPYCDHQYSMSYTRNPLTLKTFKGIYELRRIINSEKYDIVYCHTPVGGLVARLACKKARKLGTQVIYFAHGLHFYKGAPKLNWLIYYPIEKYLAHYTDKFILSSEEDYIFVKSHFKECKPNKSFELGCNFDKFFIENKNEIRKQYRISLDIPENALVLIYVAEIIKNKNQQMLLKTLQEVKKTIPNTYMLLVGPEHDNGKCKMLAQKMNILDSVRFLGWRSDIAQLFYCSDFCTASSIREGFGYNLVEAMACGVPVITTANRGHMTIVQDGHNGYLIQINDYNTMANRIQHLVYDVTLSNRLLKQATRDIEKYREQNVLDSLYDFIVQ
jgi:glycosyltransferase EpsD